MGASRVEVRTILVVVLLLLHGTDWGSGFVNHLGTVLASAVAIVGGIINRGSRHFSVASSEYTCMLSCASLVYACGGAEALMRETDCSLPPSALYSSGMSLLSMSAVLETTPAFFVHPPPPELDNNYLARPSIA